MKAAEIIEKVKDSSDEYVLRTVKEEETYLANYRDIEVDKVVKETHGRYDKDIEEVTGLKKPDGVKTHEFMKETLTKWKSKAGEASILEAQVRDLNKQLRDKGTPSAEILKQLDDLKAEHKKIIKERDEEITKMRSQFTETQKSAALDHALSRFAFDKSLPETVVRSHVNMVKNELLKDSDINEGKLVFKKDGNVLIDRATLNPLTAEELLTERLADVLDKGGKAGTGTKGGGQKQSSDILIPDSALVSKSALSLHLQEELITKKGYTKGNVRNSPDYIKLYGEHGKDLPYE